MRLPPPRFRSSVYHGGVASQIRPHVSLPILIPTPFPVIASLIVEVREEVGVKGVRVAIVIVVASVSVFAILGATGLTAGLVWFCTVVS